MSPTYPLSPTSPASPASPALLAPLVPPVVRHPPRTSPWSCPGGAFSAPPPVPPRRARPSPGSPPHCPPLRASAAPAPAPTPARPVPLSLTSATNGAGTSPPAAGGWSPRCRTSCGPYPSVTVAVTVTVTSAVAEARTTRPGPATPSRSSVSLRRPAASRRICRRTAVQSVPTVARSQPAGAGARAGARTVRGVPPPSASSRRLLRRGPGAVTRRARDPVPDGLAGGT